MSDAAVSRSDRRPGQSAFLPILLLALALVGWAGFQTAQLVRERQQLAELLANQNAQVEAATKLRASLDTMASATARLAEGGNVNAKLLVDELRKRGITINPNAALAPAPKK